LESELVLLKGKTMKTSNLLKYLLSIILILSLLPVIPVYAQEKTDDLLPPDDIDQFRDQLRGGFIGYLPNDPASGIWNKLEIGADLVWENRDKSPDICLLDSGVQMNHEDLAGKVIAGLDIVNGDGDPSDDYGQGTRAAGVISAINNNSIGTWGISNGKVIAVKVLDSDGNGTAEALSAGINYCAKKKSVKIIQISNWGNAGYNSADDNYLIYNALKTAIKTKKKLVVAAAGDGSKSAPYYPAAWAVLSTNAPFGLPNQIYQGLISVGAARHQTNDPIQVGDGLGGSNEYRSCATPQSNYGSWVKMVAPGDGIDTTDMGNAYITTDVAAHPSNDQWQGTSMAAAHVSGAAARLWSINKKKSNIWITNQLMNTGSALNLAVDPLTTSATTGYNLDGNGDPQANGYTADGPFCWPNTVAPFGAEQDMSASRYLELAKAMNRGAIEVGVMDAISGAALEGASIRAVKGVKVIDTALVGSNGMASLINLPVNTNLNLLVNFAGYTRGWQKFNITPVRAATDTYVTLNNKTYTPPFNRRLGIAPLTWGGTTTDFNIIANWEQTADLHLSVWLPKPAKTDYPDGGIIGASPYPGSPLNLDYGNLTDKPYTVAYDSPPTDATGFRSQLISVIRARGKKYPYYYPGKYTIFMDSSSAEANLINYDPVVRVWYNGKILKMISGADLACTAGQTWWKAGWLARGGSGGKVGIHNFCTDGTSGGFPY